MTEDWPPPQPDKPLSREILFEFQRQSDGSAMSAEIRNHGELLGWEIVIYERGELLKSRAGFITRQLAERFAEEERKAMEQGDQ